MTNGLRNHPGDRKGLFGKMVRVWLVAFVVLMSLGAALETWWPLGKVIGQAKDGQ